MGLSKMGRLKYRSIVDLNQEFLLIIGGKIMDELRTTPHDFIWRVKNPQDYWADTLKEVPSTFTSKSPTCTIKACFSS